MLTIGITGGIGSGKSTVARILERYGAKLMFADDIAKEIMMPGMAAYKSIVDEFGSIILNEDESINHKKLGEIVFADKSRLNLLNKITHDNVSERIKKQLNEYRSSNNKLVVVEAIVPKKIGFLDLMDTVWVVLAPEALRIDRVIIRSGITRAQAKKRILSQMSDDMYKSIADKVIYNDGA